MARIFQLAAIGTIAGVFSGLFGVGGGVVVVPLLIVWLGYGEREAAGTSLAAIIVIAAAGSALHGALGSVDILKGLLIGIPAVIGVVLGTHLQQRIPQRTISILFAAILVGVAIAMLI